MAEEPTPLAQRLRAIVSPIVWSVQEATTPEEIDALGDEAVVAVLRELAAFLGEVEQDRPDLGVIYRPDLTALADSIEKGGGDD
jgi:hypothetical protein